MIYSVMLQPGDIFLLNAHKTKGGKILNVIACDFF